MTIDQLYNEANECTYTTSPKFNRQRAAELFSQVIEMDPKYKSAIFNRAQCYFALGRYEEYIHDMLEDCNQNPDTRIKILIADAYSKMGNNAKALDLLHGENLDPQILSVSGLHLRQKLYLAAGKPELAETDRKKAEQYEEEQRKLWDDPNYYGHYK